MKTKTDPAKTASEMDFMSRVRHSIFGFILGDCLGVPYEFQRPGTFKFKPFAGNGSHNQPPGTWSDDTALMLVIKMQYDGI